MSANTEGMDFALQVEAFRRQTGGLIEIGLVMPGMLPNIRAAAAAGDDRALMLQQSANAVRRQVAAAPRKRPVLCSCCPQPLASARYAVCVAIPGGQHRPSHGITFGVCRRCGDTEPAVHSAAIKALQILWPETRPITITHPFGGRA